MMRFKSAIVAGSLSLVCLALLTASAQAGKGCDKCGGHKQVKYVTCLVATCEDVAIPQYQSNKTEAFCPDKGKVCHTGYRCDTFTTLYPHHCVSKDCHHSVHEHCEKCYVVDKVGKDGKGGCGCGKKHGKHEACSVTAVGEVCHCEEVCKCRVTYDYYVECCSKTTSGCKTLHGAKATGCHSGVAIEKPTGDFCVKQVYSYKWVSIPLCEDCKGKGKR